MRIAVIGFPYNNPTGTRNIKLIEELSKTIKIDLITVSHWKGYQNKKIKQLENKNLKIHLKEPVFLSKKSLQFRYYMKDLFKTLKQINPDLIYIMNEPLALNTFLSVIYAKKLKKKVMCFTWENLFIKKNTLINLYERFTLKKIDRFIAGTKDAKKVLIRKGVPKDNITVMPQTGIDTKLFRNKKDKKEPSCLFIGRLEKEKGIDYILKAKKILDNKGIKLNYIFVGDGALYPKLKNLSQKDPKIKLLGWTSYNKLPEIYNKAGIFLYPSIPTKLWEEQFGYSIVEAMACGLPAISTDMSGPREIIKNKEDGFIIKSKNPVELADKIEYLAKNKKTLSKFSKNASINIKRFENKVIAKQLLKIIK